MRRLARGRLRIALHHGNNSRHHDTDNGKKDEPADNHRYDLRHWNVRKVLEHS